MRLSEIDGGLSSIVSASEMMQGHRVLPLIGDGLRWGGLVAATSQCNLVGNEPPDGLACPK